MIEAQQAANNQPIHDCFGFIYDPFITPCRDKCEVRVLCKEKVSQNVKVLGKKKTQEEIEGIMEKTMASPEDALNSSKKNLQIQYSEPIMQILDLMTNLGLEIHYKAGYIAGKMNKRNILAITRAQASDYSGAIKFIWTTEREQFPDDIKEFISQEKSGKFWTCVAPDLSTLKSVLEKYLTTLNTKK